MAGQTVACAPGSWLNSPTGYAYTWQRNLTAVSGQTGNQYTLTNADVGALITCMVVAHNDAGNSLPSVSGPIGPVGSPAVLVPLPTGLPAISGTPQAGNTVSCSSGSWTGSPSSYAYSWQRNAAAIAEGPLYVLTGADVNQAITCAVVATNAAGSSLPAISLPILPTLPGSGGGGGTGGSGGSGGGSGGGGGSGSGGTTQGTSAPRVLSFVVVPRRMLVLLTGERQSSKGTSFRYRLDRAATVVIVLQQLKGGGWINRHTFTVPNARKGLDILKFAGRIGRRLLGPGRYRVVIVASNPGGKSPSRRAPFSVARSRRR